jgi:sporulation protein YlmC with PRC-barrel domain
MQSTRLQANSDIGVRNIRKVNDIIIIKEKVPSFKVEETKESMSNGSTGDTPAL